MMPEPKPKEKERDFVGRFMKSKESQTDFPDRKQRLAVAYSIYKQKGKGKKSKPPKKESIERMYTVTEDTRIMLDGEMYVLEAGDQIVMEDFDWTGLVLDLVGFIPGIGEPFDAIQVMRSINRGMALYGQGKKIEGTLELFYAALSIVSMLPEPISDTGAKGAKYGIKFIKAFAGAKGAVKKIKPLAEKFRPVWQAAAAKLDDNEDTKGFAKYTKVLSDAIDQVADMDEKEAAQSALTSKKQGDNKTQEKIPQNKKQEDGQLLAAGREIMGIVTIMEQYER